MSPVLIRRYSAALGDFMKLRDLAPLLVLMTMAVYTADAADLVYAPAPPDNPLKVTV